MTPSQRKVSGPNSDFLLLSIRCPSALGVSAEFPLTRERTAIGPLSLRNKSAGFVRTPARLCPFCQFGDGNLPCGPQICEKARREVSLPTPRPLRGHQTPPSLPTKTNYHITPKSSHHAVLHFRNTRTGTPHLPSSHLGFFPWANSLIASSPTCLI